MAIFDFLENFFFISLAITFGLFLLLIYHFKERISLVEKKNDTLNEVLMNVVKEIKHIQFNNAAVEKHLGQMSAVQMGESPRPVAYPQEVVNISLGQSMHPFTETDNRSDKIYFEIQEHTPSFSKIVVSDDDEDAVISRFAHKQGVSKNADADADTDDDDDDDELSSDDETASESDILSECEPESEESESDEDDDSKDSEDSDEDDEENKRPNGDIDEGSVIDVDIDMDIVDMDIDVVDMDAVEKISNISVNVYDDEPSSAPIRQEIKNLLDNLLEKASDVESEISPQSEEKENAQNVSQSIDNKDSNSSSDGDTETFSGLNADVGYNSLSNGDAIENISFEPNQSTSDIATAPSLPLSSSENIAAPNLAEEKHTNPPSASDQKKEVYRKMNINQLRTIAISAGLAADTSKMKKAELIKLLESLDDDEDDA